jgi:hypothetical protein
MEMKIKLQDNEMLVYIDRGNIRTKVVNTIIYHCDNCTTIVG